MLEQTYNWQRFWCLRSGRINLADGGYLYDPESEWGNVYNPDLVRFEAISNTPCLALLGEPGIGKTQAMKLEQARITAKVCEEGGQVLLLDLRSYSSEDRLVRKLFESQEFRAWERGTYQLHIFLDSLDECLLRIDTVAALLLDEFKQYRDEIRRLNLRIACRTAVWPPVIEEGLKQLWGKDAVGVYELAPLRRKDIREAATVEGIDSDAFLEEVQKKNIVPLAIKPVTLKFLLNIYCRHNGQFPANQRLHELYLDGCRCLCEETNESRLASKLKGKLNPEQRLIVAARIAAVTIFANRFAIWTGIDWGNVPDEDVLLRKLCQGSESVDGREFEVTEEVVEEVLDTGLFSSRGLHRIGWAHQTYAEFLAAWYLVQHQTPSARIMSLIASSEDPEGKLIPQLHETAAWIASMRIDILQEITKTDSDVLLRSDLPTDSSLQETIVDNLLKQYEQEKLFDWDRNNYRGYGKLKHPKLAEQLRPYIQDSSKQIDTRDAAIDIAEVCELRELQAELVNLALNRSESIHLRVSAAKAICSIGDANTRLKLKPLAVGQLPEDEDDQLKGYCLSAIWSNYLTVQELFNAITPPKKRNFLGKYQIFLNHELVAKLQPNDLVLALNWVDNQGLRCFGHPFEELADGILIRAWDHFDLPGIAEGFTKVALIQWREHQKVITHNSKLSQQFESSLIEAIEKRRKLIEQAVLMVSNSEEDPYFLLSSATETVLARDIFWMLEKLQDTGSEKAQRLWVQLIRWSFHSNDPKEIDAIVTATQTNNILREEFISYFEPIELNSAKSEKMKADYLQMQERQNRRNNFPLLEPSPKERVCLLLEQLESDNLSAWWQLNREMTLKPNSRYYDDEFESDLTELPGWKEADAVTRRRIINGAKKYIQQQDEVSSDWIGTNTFNRPALAGCKALQLLLQESPDFLNCISTEIWQRWAPIIIGFPCSNQHKDYYLELVRLAYLNAPNEVISTLILLIDKENKEHDYIFILNRFERCWDERLSSALLEKAKDKTLRPKCTGQLLEELLKHESIDTREFAKSLIVFPLPLVEDERERTIFACKVLVENADPSSWSLIWSIIQQDSAFGRKVIELVANHYSHGVYLNLTEKQIADLYVWLVHQYPYNEDTDHSNDVLAHFVSTRECVANFRNSLLEQLKNFGTIQACFEIQRVAQELPELTWLKKTLLDAQNIMRRKTWKLPRPEEVLQIVSSKQPHTMKTILVLASSPVDEARLRLDKEVREIDEGLRRSQKRDQFRLEQRWAVRADDLRRALLDTQPQIVHFCGHGAGDEGLVIEDENGKSKLVSTEALASLFELCAEHVECVLLNACYSEIQADAIVQHISYVIGMEKEIGDTAAVKFAVGFYDALGAGKSIEASYKFGRNAIQLESIPEHLTPKLKKS
jgi:predicted NACHT family NTPase